VCLVALTACGGGQPAPTSTPAPTFTPAPTPTSTPIPEQAELTAASIAGLNLIKTFSYGVVYTNIALSADGKRLAQARPVPSDAEVQLQVLSLETGDILFSMTTADGVVQTSPVALSHDGRLLAYSNVSTPNSISASRTFHVYDLDAASVVLKGEVPNGGSQVFALTFSPDGSKLVVGTGVLSGDGISVWDIETGQMLTLADEVRIPTGSQMAFAAQGMHFVSTSSTEPVQIIDAETGALVRTMSAAEGRIQRVAFDPTGTYVVAGTREGQIYVWTAADGQQVAALSTQAGREVLSIGFTVDGSVLVTGESGAVLRFWDATTWTQVHELKLLNASGALGSIAFTPDGKGLLTNVGLTQVGMNPIPATSLYGAFK
jgi:WD40 repeat protein